MSTITSTHQELYCLRTHIVDFLVYRLENDLITEKRASQLARSTLNKLTDNLTHEQIHQVLSQLEQDFPDELKDLEATLATCETEEARKAVDNQILGKIVTGDIDEALNLLNQFKVK